MANGFELKTKIMTAKTKPRVVVLLGMHRSGTSLAMSVMHSLGIECGNALIPAGRSNLAGFWEHAEIVAIHEHLMASLGRLWHGPAGTYPMPENWLESPQAEQAKAALVDIVARELDATANGVWGFKDPRTLQVLPLWDEVFRAVGAEPVYILGIRHPAAVCASLVKHNGVDEERARLLWLRHNLNAIEHAGDKLRLVVDFDNLVNAPEHEIVRMAGALMDCAAISQKEKDGAAERISRKLRSHDAGDAHIENGFVREAFEGLSRLARDEGKPADLMPFVERYAAAEELFTPWRQDRRSMLTDWAVRALLKRKYG